MAIDVYLQIDGIKGESQDDKHKDWIECTSVNWGLVQPRSATASTGGGHTAERVDLEEVTFRKLADLSSPILMQTCAQGKTIPKAKFEFMRADGNGTPIKYFEIELENVLICLVSCDHLPRRSWPLFRAKAMLGELIAGFSSPGIQSHQEQLAA